MDAPRAIFGKDNRPARIGRHAHQLVIAVADKVAFTGRRAIARDAAETRCDDPFTGRASGTDAAHVAGTTGIEDHARQLQRIDRYGTARLQRVAINAVANEDCPRAIDREPQRPLQAALHQRADFAGFEDFGDRSVDA